MFTIFCICRERATRKATRGVFGYRYHCCASANGSQTGKLTRKQDTPQSTTQSKRSVYQVKGIAKVGQALQQKSPGRNSCKQFNAKQVQCIFDSVIEGDLICKVCDRVLSSTRRLRAHIRSKHMKTSEFKCKKCNKYFGEKYTLQRHMKNHKENVERVPCGFCEETLRHC